MRKHIARIALALLLVCGIYYALRYSATKAADREIDAFFAAYQTGGPASVAHHLGFLSQSREDVEAIMSRHEPALRNFSFPGVFPELNLRLNNTRVGVSWHLSIFFSRRGNRWVPTYFDEFRNEPAEV